MQRLGAQKNPSPPRSRNSGDTPSVIPEKTLLVPYYPSSSSSPISNTLSSPREDPVSQEPKIADAICNIMTDLLAIAEIQDTLTSTKLLHALEAAHRELAFLLETEGLGKAHLWDILS